MKEHALIAASRPDSYPSPPISVDAPASTHIPSKATNLGFTTLMDVLSRPSPRDLVKHLLPEVATSCVYGRPGCGKSFVVLDLLCRVAAGMPVWGQPALSGFTVYVATEGTSGLTKRARAWLEHHAQNPEEVPVFFIEHPINLRDVPTVTRLIEAIRSLEKATGRRCRLVCVDTLVQCLYGDENRQDDMSEFVAACSRLAKELATHVLVVHHTGKREADGPRGSSVLHGNFDALFSVVTDEEEHGTVLLTALKQKDDRKSEVRLSLQVVEVGFDEDGEPITTCIVARASTEELIEERAAVNRLRSRLSPNEEKALGALQAKGTSGMTRSEWLEAARQVGVGPTRSATARECVNAVIKAGKVIEAEGRYFAL